MATAPSLHDDHGHAALPVKTAERIPLQLRIRSLITKVAIALYLPSILQGMSHTFRYMFRPTFTMQYPEQRHTPRKGYRGEHRLKKDENGNPKCVACFMCQTACPAECITIVAKEVDWPGREKAPASFDIDLLKCIYCGMCEEACPCDAIELTTAYTKVATTRAEKVYSMEKLLATEPSPHQAEPSRSDRPRSGGH